MESDALKEKVDEAEDEIGKLLVKVHVNNQADIEALDAADVNAKENGSPADPHLRIQLVKGKQLHEIITHKCLYSFFLWRR